MSIESLMVDAGPDVFYDPAFRNVLEDHIPFLRERHSTLMILKPDESYQWRGDLYGLLHMKGMARQYHWLIMRLNAMTTPRDFNEDTLTLLVPNFTVIEQILQSHNAAPRIS
jgi:hypothetical protein